MDRKTDVHSCGGSELEDINGRKDFNLGPRLEGTTSFQFSSRGNRKFLKQLRGEQMFYQHTFPIQECPLVVINHTSLKRN